MIIHTEGLRLVRHQEPDPLIQEIINDPAILEKMAEARSYPGPMPASICFRLEKDDNAIGQACVKNIKWINHKAEVSLFVRSDMQGQGIGSNALKALLEFGFKRLNLYRIEAEVIDGNTPSVRLLEKNNFSLEGRLREAKFVNGLYFDLLRYGLLRREYEQES